MDREIKLDGGEISLLKAIGLSGTAVYGKMLADRAAGMETAAFLETLTSLINQGYVLSSRVNIESIQDAEGAFFRVNAAYARDLRYVLNPGRRHEQERASRRREQQRTRRQRRR